DELGARTRWDSGRISNQSCWKFDIEVPGRSLGKFFDRKRAFPEPRSWNGVKTKATGDCERMCSSLQHRRTDGIFKAEAEAFNSEGCSGRWCDSDRQKHGCNHGQRNSPHRPTPLL